MFQLCSGFLQPFLVIKRELLDTVKARKVTYYGHTVRKQGSCLENEIMQGTMLCARRRGRPRTAWMDNINTWTGLPVEVSITMTEDRDKWIKYVRGVPTLGLGRLKNRTTISTTRQFTTYRFLVNQHTVLDQLMSRVDERSRDKWRKYVHDVASPRNKDG